MKNRISKWFIYSFAFFLILCIGYQFDLKLISISILLGFFAALFNEILNQINK